MSDDLMLPQVPEARSEDPEDVSWALSTAEAMWARGDHSEGIKWVRRAAEAASEAENDARALELAKAAADLAGMIARRTSAASIDLEEVTPGAPPPVPAARPAASAKPTKPGASVAPPKPVAPAAVAVKPATLTPSRPPPPVAPRASSPPTPKNKPVGTSQQSVPPTAPAAAPKAASVKPAAPGKKSPRRSRENLDAEARAAALATETVTHLAPEPVTARRLPADTGETLAVQVPHRRRSRPDAGNNDPTLVGHVDEIVNHAATDEWDAAAVVANGDGERKTAVPANLMMTMQSAPRTAAAQAGGSTPPATVAGTTLGKAPNNAVPGRAAASEQHDPRIMTSQAVRVVVWRDANGVHVAPAGTVVSAITVDAVLVALEPNADLTAWLSTGPRR